jgi:hypothetical protein
VPGEGVTARIAGEGTRCPQHKFSPSVLPACQSEGGLGCQAVGPTWSLLPSWIQRWGEERKESVGMLVPSGKLMGRGRGRVLAAAVSVSVHTDSFLFPADAAKRLREEAPLPSF